TERGGGRRPNRPFGERRSKTGRPGVSRVASRSSRIDGGREPSGRRIRSRHVVVERSLQAIAEPAYRHDPDVAALELATKPVHIDFDGVVTDLLAPFAQVIDDLFLADQPVDALQQDFEHAELAGREIERLAVQAGDSPDLVVAESANRQSGAAHTHASSQ